ncbi:hypothetical protein DFH27DRAFT_209152 [Peziza echinospora]|nr:hypothetical protein DFH27DRAFT_209152 [Peziza echinospora]
MSSAPRTQQHTPPASPKSKSCTITAGDDLVEELCDCGGKKKGHTAKVDQSLKKTRTFTNDDGDIVEEAGSDSDQAGYAGYSDEDEDDYESSEPENNGDTVVEARDGEVLGFRTHSAPDDVSGAADAGKKKKSKSSKKKGEKGEKVRKTRKFKDEEGNKVKEANPEVDIRIRTHDLSDEKKVNKSLFGASSVVVVPQKSQKVKSSTDAEGNSVSALKSGTSARPRLHGVVDSDGETAEAAETESYRNADGDKEEVAVGEIRGLRTHSDLDKIYAEEVTKSSSKSSKSKSSKSPSGSPGKVREEKRSSSPPQTATLTDEDGNIAIVADGDETSVRAHAAGW